MQWSLKSGISECQCDIFPVLDRSHLSSSDCIHRKSGHPGSVVRLADAGQISRCQVPVHKDDGHSASRRIRLEHIITGGRGRCSRVPDGVDLCDTVAGAERVEFRVEPI